MARGYFEIILWILDLLLGTSEIDPVLQVQYFRTPPKQSGIGLRNTSWFAGNLSCMDSWIFHVHKKVGKLRIRPLKFKQETLQKKMMLWKTMCIFADLWGFPGKIFKGLFSRCEKPPGSFFYGDFETPKDIQSYEGWDVSTIKS